MTNAMEVGTGLYLCDTGAEYYFQYWRLYKTTNKKPKRELLEYAALILEG